MIGSRHSARGGASAGFLWTLCLAALVTAISLSSVPAQADGGLETDAPYAIIIDYDTGLTLFEKNADDLMAPSSMSKLMTLEILFDRLKRGAITLEDTIKISVNAWRRGGAATKGSTMFAEVNSNVPVADILRGIIVQSGNDACIAVAEEIAGTEEDFANLMTRRARELGMEQSIFANSTGWPDPGQLMTARELAMLARHIIKTYPDYYPLFAEKEFTWNKIRQSNRNPLLHLFRGADGLKTGHTEDAGYGLVGAAERNGRRFILVVNGLGSDRARATETRRLMTLAFGAFEKRSFFDKGDTVGEVTVFKGEAETVPLVIADTLEGFVQNSERRNVKVSLTYNEPLIAPLAKGEEVGTLSILVPGQKDLVTPVYTGADVAELGFFGKAAIQIGNLITGEKPPEPQEKTSVNAFRR